MNGNNHYRTALYADYLITGVLKVVKKDNYLLFSNPGSLRIPVERIYKGDYSKSRNPRIQNMFRMIGFGENIGSGFPTILRAWKEEKWREPDLREVSDVNTVELKLWTTSLLPQRISEQLHELFGSSINHLMADEQRILAGRIMLQTHDFELFSIRIPLKLDGFYPI